MNVLPPESERKIHYHVDSFMGSYISSCVMAAVAITALVVGTLALLHSYDVLNCGPLGCIPVGGGYTLLAGGSVLLVAVAIILKVIHDCKDKQLKPLKLLYDPQWYPQKAPTSTFTTFHDTVYITQSDGTQEVHHFSKMDELRKFTSALEDNKIDFCGKLEIETGADVHFHGANPTENQWLDSFVMFLKDFTPWKNAFELMAPQVDAVSFHTLGYTSVFEPLAFKERPIYCVLQATVSGEKSIHLFMQHDPAKLHYEKLLGESYDGSTSKR